MGMELMLSMTTRAASSLSRSHMLTAGESDVVEQLLFAAESAACLDVEAL
jgi:hypothetical protein